MEPTESDLEKEIVRFRPPGEILWLSPPKAARMNAFLKNQYKRTLCEVTIIITTEYCNQRHEIVLSDITVTKLLNHFFVLFHTDYFRQSKLHAPGIFVSS